VYELGNRSHLKIS